MTDYVFDWDPAKAEANLRKHGISFVAATKAFDDPWHQSEMDRIEGGEYRWKTIGQINGTVFLLVAHTYRDHDQGIVVRIISAGKANREERKRYDRQDG